ncbi:MAG TPA: thioredoxin family protein [Terriglobales bacterium]|nr:thioredoxin family protein [Terriglobales bacterium]
MRLRNILWVCILSVAGLTLPICLAQATGGGAGSVMVNLDQWKGLITTGDASVLKTLYSTSPAVKITTPAGEINAEADALFWAGLKVQKLKVDVTKTDVTRPDVQSVVFQAEIQSGASSPARTLYVTEAQIWQLQGQQWRIVVVQRTAPARLLQPTSVDKDIYHPGADAHAEIKHALLEASKTHKRVIVVFGANWCFDCHVLDAAFHRPDLAVVLAQSYEVVHVDIGKYDKNQDIADQYEVPLKRGVPGVAVLDSNGKLIFSQKNGEFENARTLGPEDLLEFLKKWKPASS